MAQLITGGTPFTTANFTIHANNAAANTTGVGIPTGSIGGGLLTMFADVGIASSLTSVVFSAECSADNNTWVPALGVGNDTAPNITLTAANTSGAINFLVPTGNNSLYVRGNLILTGTSANVTCMIFGQNRIDTSAGYTNSPPNPNQ